MKQLFRMTGLAAVLAGWVACAHATVLELELDARTRSVDQAREQAAQAARQFNKNAAALTRKARQARHDRALFSLPTMVVFRGVGAPPQGRAGGSFDLVFESSGAGAFPSEYRQLLEDVFASSRTALELVFGPAFRPTTVKVTNYDASIGDRDAVAGGIFVLNSGAGQQEILFPVYADSVGFKREVAAVNFLHTLALAYVGTTLGSEDAVLEGMVRAGTARVARIGGALPAGLDRELIALQLGSTYDVGPWYDWNNQPSLSALQFIAPNLRDEPLPVGGSVGGLYLLRYQMSSAAWQKVLLEYPTFIAQYRIERVNATNLPPTPFDRVLHVGQRTIDALGGAAGRTIEGTTFAEWGKKQFALRFDIVPGTKLHVEPIPIADGLSGNDFGVFGIQAHYFRTAQDGSETLLSGTAYPIYWSPDFTRVFTAAQDDRMDLFAGYGAVVPNFPDAFSGQAYRVTVDVPVGDRLARAYLPAGGVATAQATTPNTLYGTVTGVTALGGASYEIRVRWGANQRTVPVTQFAFGTRIDDASFLGAAQVTLELVRQSSQEVLATRLINKTPGALAVNFHVGSDVDFVFPTGIPGGISMLGVPVQPYDPTWYGGLSNPGTFQFARWDPLRARYNFYPDTEPLAAGHGFFVRRDVGGAVTVEGSAVQRTPIAVAVRPGWNQIVNPLNEQVFPEDVQVVVTTGFPRSYDDAAGEVIGTEFFRFQPGGVDPASGVPERGSMLIADTFRPGEAVFVRCFQPEGATLLFTPRTARSRSMAMSQSGPPAPEWMLELMVRGDGEIAQARIGQVYGANRAFNRSVDSEAPPEFSRGLSLRTRAFRPLAVDMRHPDRSEMYVLNLSGLRRGQTYRMDLREFGASDRTITVIDTAARIRKTYEGSSSYEFRARSQSHVIRVIVRKPR